MTVGPRVGSLFAGYDGLGMAVEQLFPDSERAWFCEWDDAPSKILAHHWPDVPNFRDVTQVDWESIPPVDILTGGFPCQPFSAAGRREGQNDDRHLWPYVLEAIRALRPKYTLLENVAGLRSIGDHVDEYTFRCVCGWFGGRGGVHYSQGDEGGHRDGNPSSDRHGDEGQRSTQEDAVRVLGHSDYADAYQPEALERNDMDGDGRRGGGVPEPRFAASSIEGRAGVTGVKDRGDPNVSAEDWESRPSPLDAGSFGAVPGDLSANYGAERARANASGAGLRWDGDCPACGRALGDGSSGSVFRSGMGTIFRDLASLGLHVRWTSLRASDIGAPHHRERLFILVTDPKVGGLQGQQQRANRGGTELAEPHRSVRTLSDASGGRPEGVHGVTRRGTARREGDGFIGRSDRGGILANPDRAEWHAGQRRTFGMEQEVSRSDSSFASFPDADVLRRKDRSASNEADAGRSHDQSGGFSAGFDWGAYRPVVERWEQVTREAPMPTELNSNGRPRLNAAFAEWMMGLPAGHVTDPAIAISRAHRLKAVGNGVCPQQAFAAYSALMAGNALRVSQLAA